MVADAWVARRGQALLRDLGLPLRLHIAKAALAPASEVCQAASTASYSTRAYRRSISARCRRRRRRAFLLVPIPHGAVGLLPLETAGLQRLGNFRPLLFVFVLALALGS